MDIKFHWRPEEDNAFEEFTGNISDKDTMAFFNPKLPIMARVEATYNEGLSGLSQQSTRGWQPVHFISCRMTDVEQRYSQTEKDAYVCNRLKINFPSCLGCQGLWLSQHINHSCLRVASLHYDINIIQPYYNSSIITIILTNLSYLFCCLTEKFVIWACAVIVFLILSFFALPGFCFLAL